jgi:hypothetical protein
MIEPGFDKVNIFAIIKIIEYTKRLTGVTIRELQAKMPDGS